jgi:hypothetical protein
MAPAQVKAAHEPSDRPSIRLSLGQHVEVGGRDDEWPEFVFVTTCDGNGWVPSRHLSMSPGSAVVRVEYDTTELATEGGEQVEVLEIDGERLGLVPRSMRWRRPGSDQDPGRIRLSRVLTRRACSGAAKIRAP